MMRSDHREYLVFLSVITAYAILAFVLTHALDVPERFIAFRDAPMLMALILSLNFIALAVWGLWTEPRRPVSAAVGAIIGFPRRQLAIRLCLALSIAVFYGSITSIKTSLPLLAPFYADPLLAELDATLHGGEPWVFINEMFDHGPVYQVVDFFYHPVWGFIVLLLPTSIALFPCFDVIRRKFFFVFISCWILLGNVIAGLLMSAGPVYYARVTGDEGRFPDIADHVSGALGEVGRAAEIQEYLWSSHVAGLPSFGTGISAFPSLHLAMAALFFLVATHFGWAWTLAAGIFLVMIQFGSVLLGWHYAIDGYVSIAFVVVAWRIFGSSQVRSSFAASEVAA